jgi:hypothetical protein
MCRLYILQKDELIKIQMEKRFYKLWTISFAAIDGAHDTSLHRVTNHRTELDFEYHANKNRMFCTFNQWACAV